MKIRLVLAPALVASVMCGQVEQETQTSVGSSAASLVPVRMERLLYQGGMLRVEIGDSFLLVLAGSGGGRIYVGNTKDRKVAEGSSAELRDLILAQTKGASQLQMKISAKPAKPAEPSIQWQGKSVPGQACNLSLEMIPGAGQPPMTLAQLIQTYATEANGDVAKALDARASLAGGAQTQSLLPMMPMAEQMTETMRVCQPPGRLVMRTDMTTERPLPMHVRQEITKLTTGDRIDPSLFEPPKVGSDGWTSTDLAGAWASHNGFQIPPAVLAKIAASAAAAKQ